MKVLIVTEDENINSQVSSFLENQGFDCIKYRILMKALDNLEEIAPKAIFLSAQDYPRHWKTFLQYAQGIDLKAKIILYSQKPLNQDEQDKAKFLGVGYIITRIDEEMLSGLSEFLILNHNNENPETPKKDDKDIYDPYVQEKTFENCNFLFNDAQSGKIINGKVISIDDDRLIYYIFDENESKNLMPGTEFKNCTLKTPDKICSVDAVLEKADYNGKFQFKLKF
ncbi:MAG: hypothetical protein K6G52_08970 [Treponemataceae bacterium]|nr:hypothetical protein [Treponemataceae bacterium]